MIDGQLITSSHLQTGQLLVRGNFSPTSFLLIGESVGSGNLLTTSSLSIAELLGNATPLTTSSLSSGELLGNGYLLTSSNWLTVYILRAGFLTSSESVDSASLSINGFLIASQSLEIGQFIANGFLFATPSYVDTISVFQEYFGVDATQNTDSLVISKLNLLELSVGENNTAASIFVSLLLMAQKACSSHQGLISIKCKSHYFGEDKRIIEYEVILQKPLEFINGETPYSSLQFYPNDF